ncbi:MAG: TIM barrel protein [Dehalococcoidia bacterium]
MTVDLPRASLSTMWAVQPRFEGDRIADFPAAAAEAGFAGIEINHSMDLRQARTLLEAARAFGVETRTLHAPAPSSLVEGAPPGLSGRENRTLNLASLDETERRLAVAHHIASIEFAARARMQAVVVHLGGIYQLDVTIPAEDWLRARYLEWYATFEGTRSETSPRSQLSVRPGAPLSAVEGPVEGPGDPRSPRPTPSDASPLDGPPLTEAWIEHIELARRQRAEAAPPWLEAARRSLAELAPRAAEAGLTLGLESRLRYNEFPLPDEAAYLLADYPPEVAGYWHDVGHVEVLARIGVVPLEAWRTLLATRLVGAHIHDVHALTDHRAPGLQASGRHEPGRVAPHRARGGGVNFEALARALPPTAFRTFEVDQRESADLLVSGLALARTAGVVG